MPKQSRHWGQGLWILAAAVVLAGVFGLYLQPDFLVQLSSQLWACF